MKRELRITPVDFELNEETREEISSALERVFSVPGCRAIDLKVETDEAKGSNSSYLARARVDSAESPIFLSATAEELVSAVQRLAEKFAQRISEPNGYNGDGCGQRCIVRADQLRRNDF